MERFATATMIFTVLFLFIHVTLLNVGVVNGVAPYDNLSANLTDINSFVSGEINPTGTTDVQGSSIIDAFIGGVSQLGNLITLIAFALELLFDSLGLIIYMFTGVYQTMEAIGIPSVIVSILGTAIVAIQGFGILFFLLRVVSSVSGVLRR